MRFDPSRIIEEVTRTSIELLMREPFYSHFFSALNKEVVPPDSGFQTMAVGLRERSHTLFINPQFWDQSLTDKAHRYGVIKHEVLHIVFKHTLERTGNHDRHLMNIAMDLVVNQYIDPTQLPTNCIFLEHFPELNLLKDQAWRYYYDRLMDLAHNLEGIYKDSAAAHSFMSIERSSHGLDRHVWWEQFFKLDNVERSLLDAHIEHLVHIAHAKTPLKSYGTLPAGLRVYIEGVLFKSKPLVDWRRVVKLFSESSSNTRVHNTLKRPSKRYGTVPGIKIKKLRKLLVAIDTSGSISKEELSSFFNEIYHIWRQGAEIEVVECDARVQRAYPFSGKVPEFIFGRGGTDFNPPIEYGNTRFYPDGLIYFTDGVAPPPTVHPRFPLLWVISRNGLAVGSVEFKNLPGRKARLV